MAQAIRVFTAAPAANTNPNPAARLGRRVVEVSSETSGPKAVTNLNLRSIRKEQEEAAWAQHKGEIDLAAQAVELSRPTAEAMVTAANQENRRQVELARRAAVTPTKCSNPCCKVIRSADNMRWVGVKGYCSNAHAPRGTFTLSYDQRVAKDEQEAEKSVDELFRRMRR